MTTDFRFVAYRDFKRTLGKINAVVECAELATRKFVDEAEHDTDPDKFVQQVSAEFKVWVDKLDMPSREATNCTISHCLGSPGI